MMLFKKLSAAALMLAALASCQGGNEVEETTPAVVPDGTLYVVCEGNYGAGNGSISLYNPDTKTVVNAAFEAANGMKLGENPQVMKIHGGLGYIVVTGSQAVFVVNPTTLKEVGRITELTSPRDILFAGDNKAYVTNLYSNQIDIVDLTSRKVVGKVNTKVTLSAQLYAPDHYVYTNCYGYSNNILKIDPATDAVVATLEVGVQANSVVMDKNNKLWVMTTGGYQGSPFGYERSGIYRVDPNSFAIEQSYLFALGDYPSEIRINEAADRLYWVNGSVWAMDVTATALPGQPLIKSAGTYFYDVTVAPKSGEVYVADAIDFTQPGCVIRYTKEGSELDRFTVGVAPGSFCW